MSGTDSEILERDDNTHAQRNAAQTSMGDLDDSLPSLHVGDHVTDRDEDDAATMVVVGLPLSRAATYAIDEGTTVADVNPDYPEADHVIEVTYPQRTDVTLDDQESYAFPRERLELEAPVHDRDGDDGGEE